MKFAAFLGVVFLLAGIQDDTPADKLTKAVEKLAEQENYTFTIETKREGESSGGGGGGGRRGGFGGRGGRNSRNETGPTTGIFAKEDTLVVHSGDIQMIKKGENVVFKNKDDRIWKTEEEFNEDNASSRGGGGGGGRGGGGGSFGPASRLKRTQPPHEELSGIADKMKSVRKIGRERVGSVTCTVYYGKLTDEAAGQLGSRGGRGGMNRGGGGRGGGQTSATGTAKLYVTRKGIVIRYVFTITSGESKTIKTVTMMKFGKSKPRIPKGAKERLGE